VTRTDQLIILFIICCVQATINMRRYGVIVNHLYGQTRKTWLISYKYALKRKKLPKMLKYTLKMKNIENVK